MALEAGAKKTEHAGAKNGGGAWCKRAVAKEASNSRRRSEDLRIAREAMLENEPPIERKCIACAGEGVLPVFDVHGEQRCVATCPSCGGSRYEP